MDDTDVPIGKIADSAYRAFCAACEGLGLRPMEPKQTPWLRIAEVLGSNDGSYTVKELGEHVRQLYLAACEMPADDIDTPEGELAAIAWQAVGLHLFNLIQGGAEGNLRQQEATWAAWATEHRPVAPRSGE